MKIDEKEYLEKIEKEYQDRIKKNEENIKTEERNIAEIVQNSVVTADNIEQDTLGRALIRVIDFVGDENNRHLLSNSVKEVVWEMAIISGIIKDLSYDLDPIVLKELIKDNFDEEIFRLCIFIEEFKLVYNTGRSSVGGLIRNDIRDIFSSIMALKSTMEIKEAGVRQQEGGKLQAIKERFKR